MDCGATRADNTSRLSSLRGRLLSPYAFWLVVLAPFLVAAAIHALVTVAYGIPESPQPKACVIAPSEPLIARFADDGALGIRRGSATQAQTEAQGSAGCDAFTETTVAAGIAMVRARALSVIAFVAAGLIALLLLIYAVLTIPRFAVVATANPLTVADIRALRRPAVISLVGAIGVAAVAATTIRIYDVLPHAATLSLFDVMKHLKNPQILDLHAGTARGLVLCGSWLLVFVGILYVFAQAALARIPQAADWKELAPRFERLTTLVTLGSLAFAVALVTVVLLLSWPLAIERLAPEFAATAAVVQALFGLYLTVILLGAYLPAAAILSARAEALALDQDKELPQEWLAKRGLTVITTPRLIASLATLLPLIAGGATSTLVAAILK